MKEGKGFLDGEGAVKKEYYVIAIEIDFLNVRRGDRDTRDLGMVSGGQSEKLDGDYKEGS